MRAPDICTQIIMPTLWQVKFHGVTALIPKFLRLIVGCAYSGIL